MKTITFTSPPRTGTTKIIAGTGAISSLPLILKDLSADRALIVYDTAVKAIAETAANICSGYNPVLIAVPSGDNSKSLTEVERITELMLDAGCTRSTVLVALGGGMMTDLGGFIGSIFMRGIPTILIPTSVLAMVDAALGGKTAVNIEVRKNIVGTITDPAAVICDIDFVKALSPTLFSEGLVEAIKVAAIADAEFFVWLETNLPLVLARDIPVLTECVLRAIEAKLRVVSKDIDDSSLRLHLNFGHTIAHALEAVSSFSLSHGQAVAIGMVFEMRAAETKDARRIEALLTALDMPLEIPSQWKKPDLLWQAMQSDKKNIHGKVRIAVPTEIGKGTVITLDQQRFLDIL